MDRRQDQVVLIQERHAGLIAGRARWVEGEFRKEAFAGRISASDLFELNEIGTPNLCIFVDAIEMWVVPETGTLQIGRPFGISKISDRLNEGSPVIAGAGRRGKSGSAALNNSAQ